MAYDQVGRTSPVAGPVATYPWVERAVQNTLKLAPADKIVLGMPLYMRLWYESKDGRDLPQNISELAGCRRGTAGKSDQGRPG